LLRYFDSPSEFDASIEGNAELEAIEDELRESCSDYMRRFFVFVNAVAVYYLELRQYLNDLKVLFRVFKKNLQFLVCMLNSIMM